MSETPMEPSAEGRAFEQAVWRAIQSYPGTLEIDNVQRFREHLWRLDQPSHQHSAVPFMAGYLAAIRGEGSALERVLADLREEVERAREKHAPIHSPHEGWAVIREELDPELWKHVCADTGRSEGARTEALQVAAMGVRYILDLIDDPPDRRK